MAIILKQMNPVGSATTWDQTCGYWRYDGSNRTVCPTKCLIKGPLYAGAARVISSVTGGWVSGQVGCGCAGTDAYISDCAFLAIDVWKALADGAWSSSTAFTVYSSTVNFLAGAPVSVPITAGPGALVTASGFSPVDITKNFTVIRNESCPTTAVGTLTFYDDGTFTFA